MQSGAGQGADPRINWRASEDGQHCEHEPDGAVLEHEGADRHLSREERATIITE